MAHEDLSVSVGPLRLRSPLIAASGTVGSVWEWAEIADVSDYGAAVAKSVSPTPWPGRPQPRLAPTGTGMLNGIGIQNPGIVEWARSMEERLRRLEVPVWGSAVAGDPHGFALVAKGLEAAGAAAIEINLSCPNLEDGEMFSFSATRSRDVIEAVVASSGIPVGVKLSPNTPDVVGVSVACHEAGADFLVLTNTALGFGLSTTDRRPLLSGGVGGYSGPGLKPLSLRCVYEVSQTLVDVPIIGCGGVSSGSDLAEYLIAGASAVEAGTIHLAEPRAGRRILKEFRRELTRLGVSNAAELVGTVEQW
ncbi:MAG TPA: dihydroorotate dehydrogenase [Acidimicrobiia bacterium]|nr:dihydroorotate dehydrogenase [Acidimicrobiia bacterium]